MKKQSEFPMTLPKLIDGKLNRRSSVMEGEQYLFNQAINKFRVFLSQLNQKGVPKSTTDRAYKRLIASMNGGEEPTIKELFARTNGLGLVINGLDIPLLKNTNQLTRGTANFNIASKSSARTISDTDVGGLLKTFSAADPTGTLQIASMISSIIPKEIVDKTFGQVFANGLNFKCWGSSWTPKRAQQELPQFIALIQQRFRSALQVPNSQLQNSLNKFFREYPIGLKNTDTNGKTSLEAWIGWLNDTAKDCTKEGLKALDKGIDNSILALKNLLPQIGQQLGVKITVSSANVTFYRWRNTKKGAYIKNVPQVTVSSLPKTVRNNNVQTPTNGQIPNITQPNVQLPQLPQLPQVPQIVNVPQQTHPKLFFNPVTQRVTTLQPINQNTKSKASFGGTTGIVIAGLALATLLISKNSS